MVAFRILVVEDCPSTGLVTERLAEALEGSALEPDIEVRVVRTAADAAAAGFAGSPTITMDGRDLFPGGSRSAALACRLYPHGSRRAGAPTVEQLRTAIAARGR